MISSSRTVKIWFLSFTCEDIDGATVILTIKKRAFCLRAWPDVRVATICHFKMVSSYQNCACDFVDELPDFYIDLFPAGKKRGRTHRKIYLGYWEWPWKVNWRRRRTTTKRKTLEFRAKQSGRKTLVQKLQDCGRVPANQIVQITGQKKLPSLN